MDHKITSRTQGPGNALNPTALLSVLVSEPVPTVHHNVSRGLHIEAFRKSTGRLLREDKEGSALAVAGIIQNVLGVMWIKVERLLHEAIATTKDSQLKQNRLFQRFNLGILTTKVAVQIFQFDIFVVTWRCMGPHVTFRDILLALFFASQTQTLQS